MTSNDSDKICLSFSPRENSFQQGRLGLESSKVAGILKINYPSTKPLLAKKIELVFSGKEEIVWTEYQPNGRGYTTSVVQSEQHEFVHKSIIIWEAEYEEDKGKESYETINNMELPFSFKLESNLPSSTLINYDDGSGRIYYRVIVIIHRKSNLFKLQGKKKIEKFVIPITKYAKIPYKSEMIFWNSEKEKRIGYDIKVEREIFTKGETITIPIKIMIHNSRIKIKKISAGINQFTELQKAGNLVRPRESQHISWEEVEGDNIKSTTDSEQEYYVEITINIPDNDIVRYSLSQTLIIIWHQIEVKIFLESAHDISLEREIKIINIPKKTIININMNII